MWWLRDEWKRKLYTEWVVDCHWVFRRMVRTTGEWFYGGGRFFGSLKGTYMCLHYCMFIHVDITVGTGSEAKSCSKKWQD